jgi:hypothetical protein
MVEILDRVNVESGLGSGCCTSSNVLDALDEESMNGVNLGRSSNLLHTFQCIPASMERIGVRLQFVVRRSMFQNVR